MALEVFWPGVAQQQMGQNSGMLTTQTQLLWTLTAFTPLACLCPKGFRVVANVNLGQAKRDRQGPQKVNAFVQHVCMTH